jgi:hypothetical protein
MYASVRMKSSDAKQTYTSGKGNEKSRAPRGGRQGSPDLPEHTCWDPKDGELCLDRMKPEETLVEV